MAKKVSRPQCRSLKNITFAWVGFKYQKVEILLHNSTNNTKKYAI